MPFHVLNRLESLALDIFSFDLSVPGREWSQWLAHLLSYHKSLSSPRHPQPISRPGSNPHAIIRKTIEEVIEVSASPLLSGNLPQPVFIGLEERRREKMEMEMQASEVSDIDLDEDGPLREEYVPRRRSLRNAKTSEPSVSAQDSENNYRGCGTVDAIKHLPPPAKWSPAGDEPILRNRTTGHYIAVQPPHVASHSVNYHPAPVASYNSSWNVAVYGPMKTQLDYVQDCSYVQPVLQNTYTHPYLHTLPLPHSHSQSFSYNQDDYCQFHGHARSYSRSISEYCGSDLRVAVNEHVPFDPELHWSHGYAYSTAPSFGPIPTSQTTWLRV